MFIKKRKKRVCGHISAFVFFCPHERHCLNASFSCQEKKNKGGKKTLPHETPHIHVLDHSLPTLFFGWNFVLMEIFCLFGYE
jgi:hypothetical protein